MCVWVEKVVAILISNTSVYYKVNFFYLLPSLIGVNIFFIMIFSLPVV